ncbi:hypothetical protein M569_07646, partial [Genlisea aurea]
QFRNAEEVHRKLVLDLDSRQEDPHYGLVENEGDFNSVLGFTNGEPCIISLHMPSNHHHRLHPGAGSDLTTFALLD